MGRTTSKFIARDLSWLEFNQRVLEEARDATLPLLERLKFLAITASNLDEFFMVRVGGLQMQVREARPGSDPSGIPPHEQLRAVRERTHTMIGEQYACYLEQIQPLLAEQHFRRVLPEEMNERQLRAAERAMEEEIQTVLTPMAINDDAPFPLLSNHILNLCVRLKPSPGREEPRFAIIPFGPGVSRFLSLPTDQGHSYILIEHAVGRFINRFFPGEEVEECVPFRISRNADLGIREDLAFDLLTGMEDVLNARKHSDCVRLEIAAERSQVLLSFLEQKLSVDPADVYPVTGPLALADFIRLTGLQEFERLNYRPWPPQSTPGLDPRTSLFEVLSQRDLMLSHPYESYEPVVRLLNEAADDPDVLAIKQILYRTSRDSPIIHALRRAARNGKNVTALVELKARFDEARNIAWARDLEQAGVQVIYGVKGLKTHAKICIIVRREPQGIQRYMHFGTGNYNEITARLYGDISLMTTNEDLGADATAFFNAISGYSQPLPFRKLAAAPIGMREKLLEMIEIETEQKRQGRKASITAKLNSLSDPGMIEALYAASQAGVRIRLNVRGICCLRPGVEKLSENIIVTSIVDRFLEHSRIFHFRHGGDERVYISSADWMTRNLDRRVELLIPVIDPACRARLIAMLECYFLDTVKAWSLQPDGSYARIRPAGRRKVHRSQEVLYAEACEATRLAQQSRPTVFEPHRAAS